MIKRIGVYSFFDKDGIADNYVEFMLRDLRKSVEHLIVVIRGEVNEKSKVMFESVADEVYNCDITFPKSELYRFAIVKLIGSEKLQQYDTLVLADNSFFGPFISFEEIIEKANIEKPDADFWGLSCVPTRVNEEEEYEFDLHPYFLAIRSKMLHSYAFFKYWEELPKAENETQSERLFDKSFTRFFREDGWTPEVIYDTTSYDSINNTIFNASILLEEGFPIVKRAVFLTDYRNIVSQSLSSDSKMVLEYVRNNTSFDVEMIYENIIRCADPFNLSCILNLNFVLPERFLLGDEVKSVEKYAIFVFHMHYDVLFDENLNYVAALPECVDLIITTTSEEKQLELTEKVSENPALSNRTKVLLSDGNGRDMAGFLVEARPYLEGYRYIGFTHDKMSLHHKRTTGQAFARIILDNMISGSEYVQNVFHTFENNPHIGFLTPPPPEHGKYFAVIGRRWTGNFLFYRELCSKLGIEVNTDAESSCMALGTAFWCRPEALKSLLSYTWTHDDFPGEPLPLDGSISHAIERSFPFIAKYHGYMTGFIYNQKMATEYLNNREYMLVDYFTTINNLIGVEGNSLQTYVRKSENSCNVNSMKGKIKHFSMMEKQKARNVKKIKKSPFFDEKWYVSTYPDVRCFEGSPAQHYLEYGWLEGKDPSKDFHTEEYLRLNNDVRRARVNPLLHYERSGRREGRRYAVDYGDYRSKSFSRGLKRKLGRIVYGSKIKKNADARILVVLHLFYMCSWKEIKEYLMNLDVYNYDLIVTYTPDTYNEEVFNSIRDYKPDVKVMECDNLGYDVGPYLAALEEVNLKEYDIIFKLQSKGVKRKVIYIYGQYLKKRDWFVNLYEGCLGAFTVHKTIDKLMDSSSKVGIVAAKNLILADPAHKQHMVLDYMREVGMKVPEEYYFVAGTCFAVRSELMKPIQDRHYKLSDFTSAGKEFSLAHKMERIICLTILNDGYSFSGNRVMVIKRWLRKLCPDYFRRKRYRGVRLLDDKRFNLDDEFVYFCVEGRMIKKYELIELPLSEIKRRWLNDVIPLTECHPYRYLVTRDPKVYDEYCALNKKFYSLDIMSRDRFDNLMKSIDENGFESENVIVVNEDNIIMDGQHRCCYMLYKQGEDYRMPVLRFHEYRHIRLRRRIRNGLERILPKNVFEAIHRTYRNIKLKIVRR